MPSAAVSIGVFDGVHRGHRELIRRLRAVADAEGLRAVAVTFHPHPTTVVRPDATPLLLTTIGRRVQLLEHAGADDVEVVAFTLELSRLTPAQFADEVLRDRIGAEHVVVGAGFHFGHKASGDVETLRTLGFRAEAVDLIHDATPAGDVVSSTWIRQRIAEGDVEAAAEALARPHIVEGPVIRGEARGRGLGFPTANVDFDPSIAVPADGVYAGWLVRAGGERLPAAISVGTNPTFHGTDRTVEAYAIDVGHNLDLYDEVVAIEFTNRLRGQLAFEGIGPLIEQMNLDVSASKRLLGYT